MKRLSTLVLVVMLLVFVLASCGGNDTPAHEHSFASNWTADSTGHWHGATCEHNTEKADFAAHTDADENGKCDACAYVIFTRDTVTVDAPEGVTVSENLTAKTGTDLVFTASVSNKYLLFAEGADFVEKKVEGDTATYSFKVTAVNAESEVTITKEKYVFVDELLTGEGSFTDVVAWNTTVGEDITVSFDKAGTFYIYADNPDVSFNDMPVFEVVVEEPGEMTFATSIYSYNPLDELVYNYYVVEAETVIVIDEGGEYVLPSNLEVVLQYTAPEKGWYDITFDSDEYEYMANNGKIVYADKDSIIETAITAYAEYLPEYATGYSMSWGVEKLVATTVVAGDNTVNMDSNTSKLISFTAPETGAYSFILTNENNRFEYWVVQEFLGETFSYLASDYSTLYVTGVIQAGETIELLITNSTLDDNYEPIDEDVTDTLTITNIGFLVDPDEYEPQGIVSADGALNTIFNTTEETKTYYVNAGEGVLIGIEDENGETTWVSNYDFVVEAGESVSFLLKSEVEEATVITIVAQAVVYEVTVNFGTENYANGLIPGKTYTIVTYELLGMMKPYILTWNNTDVVISVGGMPVTSGTQFQYYPGPMTIVNNGTEVCDITIEFVDPLDIGELMIGANSVKVPFVNAFAQTFEVDFVYGGTYVLTPAEGEENLVVWYNGEEATLPLEFTVEDGSLVTLGITSSANPMITVEDTVDFVIECKTAPTVVAPEGKYIIDFGMTLYSFNFQPVEGKTYGVVEVEDFNMYSLNGTYRYAVTALGGIAMWDADNDSAGFFFSQDMGGNWSVQVPGMMMPMALTAVETPADDETVVEGFDGTLVGGANAIDTHYNGVTAVVTTVGNHTLSYAEGETNGFVIIETADYTGPVDMPYSFTVAEGETVTFIICTAANNGNDTVDVVLTTEFNGTINRGENAIATNYMGVNATVSTAGSYVLSLANGEDNGVVLIDNGNGIEMLELPYSFTVAEGETVTFVVCTAVSGDDTVNVVLSKGSATPSVPANALVLGANAVKVTVVNYFCAGVEMTFTATETGTYTFKAAEGEENAELFNINIEELVNLPYTITLEAGQSVTFNITTSAYMTLTEDTIDLVIEKL